MVGKSCTITRAKQRICSGGLSPPKIEGSVFTGYLRCTFALQFISLQPAHMTGGNFWRTTPYMERSFNSLKERLIEAHGLGRT